MPSLSDKKKAANEYRKNKDFINAIPLYENLWKKTNDAFDGTGLLNCYRKNGSFDKAIPLARELFKKHIDLEWAAREICWTLIQGKMQFFDETTPLEEVIQIAKTIFQHSPDSLAKKLSVFSVLKWAKKKDDWVTIENWIDLIEVDRLSTEPRSLANGKKGWSDQCLWYNYKINLLLMNKNFLQAKEHACLAENICPKQWLFFLRLKAHALKGLGERKEAKSIYEKLCNRKKTEWWLLHEYGNILNEVGEKKKALNILCKAALSNSKLEMMIKLFSDIAENCIENKDLRIALSHYYLEKFIREKNGWPVHSPLSEAIHALDKKFTNEAVHQSKDVFLTCKSFWEKTCGIDKTKTVKKSGLVGKITVIKEKSFCFVNTKDGLSAICFPKDISGDVNNGDMVTFDIIPSFDKKKNKESWKAIKINKFYSKKTELK